MTIVLLAAVVVASSLVLGALAVILLPLPFDRVRAAGTGILEFAGLWMVCLASNIAVGAGAVVALRHVTGVFISIYVLNDLVLVVLSALQAAGFWAWITARRT
jgi:hypothetical protein